MTFCNTVLVLRRSYHSPISCRSWIILPSTGLCHGTSTWGNRHCTFWQPDQTTHRRKAEEKNVPQKNLLVNTTNCFSSGFKGPKSKYSLIPEYNDTAKTHVTSAGQRSSPWPRSSVKVETKFHLESKLRFSCATNTVRRLSIEVLTFIQNLKTSYQNCHKFVISCSIRWLKIEEPHGSRAYFAVSNIRLDKFLLLSICSIPTSDIRTQAQSKNHAHQLYDRYPYPESADHVQIIG